MIYPDQTAPVGRMEFSCGVHIFQRAGAAAGKCADVVGAADIGIDQAQIPDLALRQAEQAHIIACRSIYGQVGYDMILPVQGSLELLAEGMGDGHETGAVIPGTGFRGVDVSADYIITRKIGLNLLQLGRVINQHPHRIRRSNDAVIDRGIVMGIVRNIGVQVDRAAIS